MTKLDGPARQTSQTDQLDKLARQTSDIDQLNRQARQTRQIDQLDRPVYYFESLDGLPFLKIDILALYIVPVSDFGKCLVVALACLR